MNEIDTLLKLIETDPVIMRYRQIEEKMNLSKDVKRQINQLKAVQKQLINARHIGKIEAVKKFEKAYDEKLHDIETFPLMSEYLALQEEINDMLQSVLKIIEDGLNAEIK